MHLAFYVLVALGVALITEPNFTAICAGIAFFTLFTSITLYASSENLWDDQT